MNGIQVGVAAAQSSATDPAPEFDGAFAYASIAPSAGGNYAVLVSGPPNSNFKAMC
jgi:hypothetical protein